MRTCIEPRSFGDNPTSTSNFFFFWYQKFNLRVGIFVLGKEGPSIVAVKTLKENATEKERSDLAQELEVMKMLDPHPNVVRLIGCCTEKGKKNMKKLK